MTFTYKYQYKGLRVKDLGLTLLFNTLIAGLLTYVYQDDPFWVYLIMSQCIGLSICTLCRCSLAYFKPQTTLTMGIILFAAIITGGLTGGFVGGWLAGIELADFMGKRVFATRIVVLSLLFGGIIAFYFFSREKISETLRLLQEERIHRLTSEKQAVQSQLKMLQAQIEPHFLFNTLSNILSLLDTDVPTGKTMLRDLTRYLRASLAETRSQWATLGGEIDLATAYLNLFKVRMGDRLKVSIDVNDRLKPIAFAPMLIQPLVENAVLHGLDAMVDGGTITIRAEQKNATLRVTVADTGAGFGSGQSQGMGLANVRDRLKALYGQQGRLMITENQPTGVQAIIEVPNAADN
jgi:signal transduction histidine kinase